MSMISNLQKSLIFALLGRIFIAELDRKSLDALQAQQISSVFEKLQTGFTSYLENTQWDDQQIEQLSSDYCHLFILPQKSGLSLRASHWMTSEESNHLAQLETLINDLKLDTSITNFDFKNVPSDHLGMLLYFMSSIYSSENKEIRTLGAPLIKLTLHPWIFRFNQNLLESTENPLYLASGKLLLELLDVENSLESTQ